MHPMKEVRKLIDISATVNQLFFRFIAKERRYQSMIMRISMKDYLDTNLS